MMKMEDRTLRQAQGLRPFGQAQGLRRRTPNARLGFTEIALVVLIALAGVGVGLARREARRVDVPLRYRAGVARTIRDIEEKTGLAWPAGRRLRVHPVRGQKQIHGGWWAVWVEGEQKYKAGFAYNTGHTVVATCPAGRMPYDTVLAHELAHQLYWAHGIPGDDHHALMRRDGIMDALPFGGPAGGY